MSEPSKIDDLAYTRWVTRTAEHNGWQEKDVAWNVAYRAAVGQYIEQEEQTQ